MQDLITVKPLETKMQDLITVKPQIEDTET